MMQSDSCLNVNSYPEAQTIDEDGNLLDYGQTNASKVSALLRQDLSLWVSPTSSKL